MKEKGRRKYWHSPIKGTISISNFIIVSGRRRLLSKMLLLLVSSTLISAAFAQECDVIHTDECGTKILPFLVDTTTIPTNEAELQEICKVLNEGDTCIKSYLEKCPNIVKKEVSDSVVTSMVSTVEDICTGNLGKRILTHGACLKENLVKNFPCNTELIRHAEAIAVAEPASDRLRLTCCAYLSLDKCISNSVTAACDERASRVIRNLLQSYAIFMVDKCLPFLSTPEKCDLSVLDSVKPKERSAKTFIPALLEIASVAF